MFNYSKYKQSSTESNINDKLKDQQQDNDGLKSTEKALDGERKDKEIDITTEGQLDSVHEAEVDETLEALIDDVDLTDEYPQRSDLEHLANPVNISSMANDAKRDEDYKSSGTDTDYWDKYTSSFNAESIKNAPSQLHNVSDRLKSLKNDDRDTSELQKMVTASLLDADAIVYHIYRQAASNGGKVTEADQSIINRINKDKAYLLAQIANVGTIHNKTVPFNYDSNIHTEMNLDSTQDHSLEVDYIFHPEYLGLPDTRSSDLVDIIGVKYPDGKKTDGTELSPQEYFQIASEIYEDEREGLIHEKNIDQDMTGQDQEMYG
jgi:hypothetical protein